MDKLKCQGLICHKWQTLIYKYIYIYIHIFFLLGLYLVHKGLQLYILTNKLLPCTEGVDYQAIIKKTKKMRKGKGALVSN